MACKWRQPFVAQVPSGKKCKAQNLGRATAQVAFLKAAECGRSAISLHQSPAPARRRSSAAAELGIATPVHPSAIAVWRCNQEKFMRNGVQ
jgi:hypothetical protein